MLALGLTILRHFFFLRGFFGLHHTYLLHILIHHELSERASTNVVPQYEAKSYNQSFCRVHVQFTDGIQYELLVKQSSHSSSGSTGGGRKPT